MPYRAIATYGGTTREIEIQPEDYPGVILLMFPEPAILNGRAATGPPESSDQRLLNIGTAVDPAALSSPTGLVLSSGGSVRFDVNFEASAYVRFLAKVALCMAVFEYGLDGLAEVFVRDLILGDDGGALTWVGELHDKRLIGDYLPAPGLNATMVRVVEDLVVVYVQLFRMWPRQYAVPIYQVVVGRRADDELMSKRASPAPGRSGPGGTA